MSKYGSNNGNADFADFADDADQRPLSGCPSGRSQKHYSSLRTAA